jgi:hypothetical protein
LIWRRPFLVALKGCGKISTAADFVEVGRSTVYDLRRTDRTFDAEVRAAIAEYRAARSEQLMRSARRVAASLAL